MHAKAMGEDPFAHRVHRYQVIKLFSRFGKIVREDFLWHKTGPREGQPRGCCFVEYATRAVSWGAAGCVDMYTVGDQRRYFVHQCRKP